MNTHDDNNNDAEAYILLTLADSNLPTGAFVASSGLESFDKHGFSSLSSSIEMATINFVRDSLGSYSRSVLPFVADAHILVSNYYSAVKEDHVQESVDQVEGRMNDVLNALTDLDDLYHSMTLNHVARRASISQGVALLTLYSKGFTRPSSLSAFTATESQDHEDLMKKLLDALKLKARREEVYGHLPVCWGILTAALGLKLGAHHFGRKIASGLMYTRNRTRTISSLVPPCSRSAVRFRQVKQPGSIRSPTSTFPCCSTVDSR